MKKDNFYIFSYICIAFLLACVFFPPDGYGFYMLTRLVVTTVSGLIIYRELEAKSIWIVIFGIVALLFNPVILVHFEQETWQVIDIITLVIISVYLWKNRIKETTSQIATSGSANPPRNDNPSMAGEAYKPTAVGSQ